MIACHAPQKTVNVNDPNDFEIASFNTAEELYQQGAYADALNMYLKYLSLSPNGKVKDQALMKIGSIYSLQGRFDDAIKIFNQLIQEHPHSILAPVARTSILTAYYQQQRYEELLQEAVFALKCVDEKEQRRIYSLMGEALVALNRIDKGIEIYCKAYEMADVYFQNKIAEQVFKAATLLDKQELIRLYDLYGTQFPAGYFLFQLAQVHIKDNEFNEAIMVLNEFIEKFPTHEKVMEANNQLIGIQQGELHDKYTIGCILPLTGVYSKFGNRSLAGIEFALFQFNQRSGVYQMRMKVKDCESSVEKTIQAIKELNEERVRAIIGPITTVQAEAASLSAQEFQIPIITLTSNPEIPDRGDFVFSNFITQEMQIQAMTDYAINELGIKDFAILYPNDQYGMTYMDRFWDVVMEKGGRIKGAQSYTNEQNDFADPIKKLVGLYYPRADAYKYRKRTLPSIVDFKAIFIPDAPERIGQIAPQLAYYDASQIKLLGTNLWHAPQLIEMAKPYVQNAIMPDGFFVESMSFKVKEFVQSYEQAFSNKPSLWEAISYDTAMLLFELMNNPGLKSRTDLRDALLRVENYDGVTGKTSFNINGSVNKQVYLIRIKDDRFEEIGLK